MELYVKSLRRSAKFQHGECVISPRLSGQSKVATPAGIRMSILDMVRMGRGSSREHQVDPCSRDKGGAREEIREWWAQDGAGKDIQAVW